MDSQSTEIYFAIVTIVTALIAILCIFVIFVVVTQKKVINLQKKLLKAEILSMEKERERVASDLHDSLGSVLAALALTNDQVVTADEQSEKIKNELTTQLVDVNEQVRQISRDLIPRFYNDTTVEQVIEKVRQDFQPLYDAQQIQLIVNAQAACSLSRVDHLHLFRIAHELLNNGCKHSAATIVNLSCILKNGVLQLSYIDNGKGYDAHLIKDGFGLSNIQNRMALLNGNYTVQTAIGKGTEVYLRIKV